MVNDKELILFFIEPKFQNRLLESCNGESEDVARELTRSRFIEWLIAYFPRSLIQSIKSSIPHVLKKGCSPFIKMTLRQTL